jgi:hypothetical protein
MKTKLFLALTLLLSSNFIFSQSGVAQKANETENVTESISLIPSANPSPFKQLSQNELISNPNHQMSVNGLNSSQSGQWIYWDNGIWRAALGTMQQTTVDIAIRFDTADLAGLDGLYMSKFSFLPWGYATYTLKVWQGEVSPVEVYSQAITDYVNWQGNIVNLTTPLVVDASQELWIGMNVIIPAAIFPLSIDEGPVVENKGNWIRTNGGEWELQPGFMGIEGNWMIRALIVETVDPVEFDVPMLNLGMITVQETSQMTVNVSNRTNAQMSLNSITTGTSYFEAEPGSLVLEAGQSMPVLVSFSPTEIGDFLDSLYVEYSGTGGSGLLKLPLIGSGQAEIIENGEWIFWDNGIFDQGLGSMQASIVDIAIRFDTTDIANYNSHLITKFQFHPRGDGSDIYTLKIWQGESLSDLVEVYSQLLTNYTLWEENIVDLTTPVVVDASQELWIGMNVAVQAATFPLATDGGPVVENKGNWIRSDNGEWELQPPSFFGYHGNWMMRALIAEDNSPLLLDFEMLDFGMIPIQQPEHMELILTNNSSATLMFQSFNTATPFFSAQPSTWSLQPSESMPVTVSFNPSTVGMYADNLLVQFSSNSGNDELMLPLFGEGTEETVSVEELERFTQKINIFPNPSNGNVTLSGLSAGDRVSVYDNSGRLMLSRISEQSVMQLNISQRGLYLVEISNQMKVERMKLIIQ